MGARGGLMFGLAIAAALLLLGRAVTALLVDHAWFTAMGLPALFWEQVIDTAILQGGAWVLGALFAFANLHAVRRTIRAVAVPARVAGVGVMGVGKGLGRALCCGVLAELRWPSPVLAQMHKLWTQAF